MQSWVIGDSNNFHGFRGQFEPTISQSWGMDLHQIWRGSSPALRMHMLDFIQVASFQNQSALYWTVVENRRQISHF